MGKGGMSHGDAGNVEGENMAAWLLGINNLKIQPFKLPPLGPKDVRVSMKAVGICGSDVHYVKTLSCAGFVVKEPMVIGHECAGIIDEVGSEVKNLVPGDRVALEPQITCWQCDRCKEGRYNLCADVKFFATPPVHGSLANQVVHPANLCFKLPDNMTLEEGAMCEPLSVGVYACRRANVGLYTNVLIVGAGPIGLVTMLAARAFGAPRIVVVDVDDYRLSVAKNLGADEIVKVSTNTKDVPEEVEKITKAMGARVDVAFDCAGFSKTMSTALTATGPGGVVCLVGMGHNEMTIPLTPAAAREVGVIGVFRYQNTWPLCLELISSGKVDVKPLITHRFGFSQEEVEEAFETSARGGTAIKKICVLLACSHAGLVDEGLEYFESIENVYGLTPEMKHYGCVVDLLSRSGYLDRAYLFIKAMPIDPDFVLWRILLSACKLHGNLTLAVMATNKLLELDPSNSGNYVLLSDTYAGSNRWDDAKEMRELMQESNVQTPSG